MPTRSGLDYHTLHPDYFVCAYCYEAIPTFGIQYRGMISKPVMHEVDGRWVMLPGQTCRIWTGTPPPPPLPLSLSDRAQTPTAGGATVECLACRSSPSRGARTSTSTRS